MKPFDYSVDFSRTDFEEHPETYRVGVGEQGTLLVQPYAKRIGAVWRFSTPEIARKSANDIYAMYEGYKRKGDFPGMDMCRKFLAMGRTRSMRYYWHAGGKKYDGPVPSANKGQSGAHGRSVLPDSKDKDETKLTSAHIFKAKLDQVLADPEYQKQKKEFEEKYK